MSDKLCFTITLSSQKAKGNHLTLLQINFKNAKKEFASNPWNQPPLVQFILDSILLVAREVDKIN